LETILVADHDLGFVFWLAERLNHSGHRTLPALSLAEADHMADKFEFNWLVINASFPDSPAFIESMRRCRRHLKVVVLSSDAKARLEQVRQLEAALRHAPWPGASRGDFGVHSEFGVNRLGPSRAALMGALLGAALWAVLFVFVIPR
jgi:hypothetical protein